MYPPYASTWQKPDPVGAADRRPPYRSNFGPTFAHPAIRFLPAGGRYDLAATSHELQHDFAPMRSRAMLGDVNALPGAERRRAADHRHMKRDSGQHCSYVSGHVVGAFGLVHP
jgi:hypothetical protein